MTKQRKCGALWYLRYVLQSSLQIAQCVRSCSSRYHWQHLDQILSLQNSSRISFLLKIAKLFRSKSNDASVLDSKSVRLKVFLFFLGNGHSSMSLRNWQKLTALSGRMANTTPLARHPAFAVAQHWKAFDVRRWKIWYLRGNSLLIVQVLGCQVDIEIYRIQGPTQIFLLAALLRLDLASSPNTAALILRKSSKRRAMHKVHKVRVRLWENTWSAGGAGKLHLSNWKQTTKITRKRGRAPSAKASRNCQLGKSGHALDTVD